MNSTDFNSTSGKQRGSKILQGAFLRRQAPVHIRSQKFLSSKASPTMEDIVPRSVRGHPSDIPCRRSDFGRCFRTPLSFGHLCVPTHDRHSCSYNTLHTGHQCLDHYLQRLRHKAKPRVRRHDVRPKFRGVAHTHCYRGLYRSNLPKHCIDAWLHRG